MKHFKKIALCFGTIFLLFFAFNALFKEEISDFSAEAEKSKEAKWQNYQPERVDKLAPLSNKHIVRVTDEENPIFISSKLPLQLNEMVTKQYPTATDNIYAYSINSNATVTVTVRTLKNDVKFVFLTLTNDSSQSIDVDIFQAATSVERFRINRYDQYSFKQGDKNSPSYDLKTMPTAILQLQQKQHLTERVIGQAYRSKAISQTYPDGSKSVMRELLAEEESFYYHILDEKFYLFHHLQSDGNDIVDSWYMEAFKPLFQSDTTLKQWIKETTLNFKKRNSWYTAHGPYNKMALTVEPMPASNKGYGRNLLLVKEDRALELYQQQGDLYFESIVLNSLVNLEIFKQDQPFWYTEITSTYLKDLYNFTAPYIDTRFNEQIALFYMRVNEYMPSPTNLQPLRDYADLLASQEQLGNVITVAKNAYYLPDYYSVNKQVTTHSSMNHMLGGISILLHAYEQFGDEKYLNVAKAQMNAIAIHENQWIRPNQDIWYKINPDLSFVGTDYIHLTLEDLTYVYSLWANIDRQYLPLLERLIQAKSSFLQNEDKGYTEKIERNLKHINLLHYLPN